MKFSTLRFKCRPAEKTIPFRKSLHTFFRASAKDILTMRNYTTQPLRQSVPGSDRLRPLLKWAGGKTQELKYILPALPADFSAYYEPFVGGGAVYTAVQAEASYINDKSAELIALYRSIHARRRTAFFALLYELEENRQKMCRFFLEQEEELTDLYSLFFVHKINKESLENRISLFVKNNSLPLLRLFSDNFSAERDRFLQEVKTNLLRKFCRMKTLENQKGRLPAGDIADNIETALHSAFYMQMRRLYNLPKSRISPALASVVFFYIRAFAYSGMFRYNSKGLFNVPYGGIAYNGKDFKKQIDYLRSPEVRALLKNTKIERSDFSDFLQKHPPTADDFIFLDPPYDTEFSTYAKNTFDRQDQTRLADYLIKDCPAKWMMVIKKTDFIADLYFDKGLNINVFDKKYLVSFMNRNDKKTEHLMIRNYG